MTIRDDRIARRQDADRDAIAEGLANLREKQLELHDGLDLTMRAATRGVISD